MADGVGDVQVLGRDHASPQDAIRIRSSEVGDVNPVATPKTLKEVERPRVRRSMSGNGDRIPAPGTPRDGPPGGAAIEPRRREDA